MAGEKDIRCFSLDTLSSSSKLSLCRITPVSVHASTCKSVAQAAIFHHSRTTSERFEIAGGTMLFHHKAPWHDRILVLEIRLTGSHNGPKGRLYDNIVASLLILPTFDIPSISQIHHISVTSSSQ
jgi:hypothetical protein